MRHYEIWYYGKPGEGPKDWFLHGTYSTRKETEEVLRGTSCPAKVIRIKTENNLVYYRKGNGLGRVHRRKKVTECAR